MSTASVATKTAKPKTTKPKSAPAKAEAAAPQTATKAVTRQSLSDLSRKYQRLASLVKLASDGTRVHILLSLAEPTNVTDLCEIVGQSQPATSHHIALLRTGGLIEGTRDGKSNFYGLTDSGLMLVSALKGLMA